MAETRAIYAGSFDPPTNGHAYVIERGAKLFDELQVTVGTNPSKTPMFNYGERVEMLTAITSELGNVAIGELPLNRWLVDYARDLGFTHILKGLRDQTDFGYERKQDTLNQIRVPEVDTVYVSCPPALEVISSSMVKMCTVLDDWEETVKGFVHPFVMQRLEEKAGA